MRHKLFVLYQMHIHEEGEKRRIEGILKGELKEADHFIVLTQGCSWADKANPGDDVRIEFGWGGGINAPIATASAKVLWTEKRPAGQLGKGILKLNLGPTDQETVRRKQFGGGVDFVSVLHLQRKGGWKHRTRDANPAPAAEPFEAAMAAMMTVEPIRLADGPAKELLALPDPSMA